MQGIKPLSRKYSTVRCGEDIKNLKKKQFFAEKCTFFSEENTQNSDFFHLRWKSFPRSPRFQPSSGLESDRKGQKKSPEASLREIPVFPSSGYFLNKRSNHNRMTAPTTHVIRLPRIPLPLEMPSKPKTQPPMRPPMIPNSRLIQNPKPDPFVSWPAMNQARAPIRINKMTFITVIF